MNNGVQNSLAFLFIAVFLITLFNLVLGLFGLLTPDFMGFISLIGLSILFVTTPSRREIMHFPGDVIKLVRSIQKGWEDFPRWLRWVTFFVCLFNMIRAVFLVWALPPFVWDSLTYHLTNVAEWTQRGRIFLIDTPVNRVALPANFEVFTTWFTTFLHHDVIVEAAGIPALAIACLATYSLARSLGLSNSAAWIATLAYGSTPALILASTGTKNDPMMAGLFLMAVSIIVALRQQVEQDLDRYLLGRVALLAMCLLYALGTKAYILQLLFGLAFIGILFPSQYGKATFWRYFPQRLYKQVRDSSSILRIFLVIGIGGCLFLGMYWYIRNWVTFGNPFYPLGVKLGDTAFFGAPENAYLYPGFERLVENLIDFANKFGDRQYVIIPALMNTTGWGWFTYILGIPALLWAFIRRPRIRVISLGFVLSLLLFFITSRPTPYNMRYIVWIPVVMALAFAALYEWLPEEFRFERFTFASLLVLCLGFNFLMTLNYNRVLVNDFVGILRIPLWNRDATKLHIYVDPEYEQALDVVPNDEMLGYNLHHDAFIYPLYRADFSQRIVYIPFSSDNTCGDLVEAMEIRGTRWLFAISERTLPENLTLIQTCVEDGYLISSEAGIYALKYE